MTTLCCQLLREYIQSEKNTVETYFESYVDLF